MTKETSTAALDSIRQRTPSELRRVPRHLPGARTSGGQRSNDCGRGREQPFRRVRILAGQQDVMATRTVRGCLYLSLLERTNDLPSSRCVVMTDCWRRPGGFSG
jgi:hypothetical protein